jgi:uncharacterized protein YneF (UPF0154 family)
MTPRGVDKTHLSLGGLAFGAFLARRYIESRLEEIEAAVEEKGII